VALAIVVLAQALACVFLSPFGVRNPSGTLARLVLYSGVGIVLAQPMLLAIGAVFGPGRWLARFPCGLAVIALLANLAVWVGPLRGKRSDLAVVIVFFILPYLLVQAPLFGVRWWRCWRISLPGNAPTVRTRRMQFSVRWLLAVATGACVVFAAARWTYGPGSFPDTPAGWWVLFRDGSLGVLLLGGLSLAAVPLVVTATGTMHRGLSLVLAAGGLGAAGAFFYWLYPTDNETLEIVTCSLPSGWVWILLNLLVLRWGGCRLVRETKAVASPHNG